MESENIGYHTTSKGFTGLVNPDICANRLNTLAEKVTEVIDDLKQDRRDRASLFSDIQLLKSKTQACKEEKDVISERLREVENNIVGIKTERSTSDKEKNVSNVSAENAKKFWLTIVGIAISSGIALAGLGLWGSKRSEQLEKQLNILVEKSVSTHSRDIKAKEDREQLLEKIRTMIENSK